MYFYDPIFKNFWIWPDGDCMFLNFGCKKLINGGGDENNVGPRTPGRYLYPRPRLSIFLHPELRNMQSPSGQIQKFYKKRDVVRTFSRNNMTG